MPTLSHHTVNDYHQGMPTSSRKTAQRTVRIDDELWSDCQLIAAERRQALADVMRAALVQYRDDNRALLDQARHDTASSLDG
jgi:hypothetical protein